MGHNPFVKDRIRCRECNKLFTPILHQIYCTKKCNHKMNFRKYYHKHLVIKFSDKKCLTCDSVFTPKRKTQLYCSEKCGANFRHKSRQLAKTIHTKAVCKNCSTLFLKKQYKSKFCTKWCNTTFNNRVIALKKRENKKSVPDVNCVVCGTVFPHYGLKKYCSEGCGHTFRNAKSKKQSSPESRERNNLINHLGSYHVDIEAKKAIATLMLMRGQSKYIIKFTKQQKKQAMIRINNGDTLAAYEY